MSYVLAQHMYIDEQNKKQKTQLTQFVVKITGMSGIYWKRMCFKFFKGIINVTYRYFSRICYV